MRALITGATGFVGKRLAPVLVADGLEVRAGVRDKATDATQDLAGIGCEVVEADLSRSADLAAALGDVDVAYFLVHMMGRETDYAEAERAAAERFAGAAESAGVKQVIYLGGLGSDPTSPHLVSREATSAALATGPPLTYFRAGMIVGSGSESYILVRDIARRLPALPNVGWMKTLTQPIGIRDVIAYLRRAPFVDEAVGREIQIGGPDVLTPLEVIDHTARALGLRQPLRVPAVGATPGVVAAGVEAITTGDPRIASELTHGLSSDTIVTDQSGMALFDGVRPECLDIALQRAIEEDERIAEPATSR